MYKRYSRANGTGTGTASRYQKAPEPVRVPGLPDVVSVSFNTAIAAEWGHRLASGSPAYTGPLSVQQQAIADAYTQTESHIMVRALAGASKSTTMERLMYLTPCNRSSMTTHQLGKRGIESAYGRVRINQYKVWDLMDAAYERQLAHFSTNQGKQVKAIVAKLVGMFQANLMDCDPDTLDMLITHHGLELPQEPALAELILEATPKMLAASYADTSQIDFDNMLSFPTVHNLLVRKYDVLMGDEVQDWNAAQIALVLKSGKRLVLVGDENQAIYGFRGADVDAMDNLAIALQATSRGLIELPLTVTRRCPVRVVVLAQQLVPTFEAAENAPDGNVESTGPDTQPEPGDMVLCRTNAPLIQGAYQALAAGFKVKIQGRDFGQGLKRFIEKLAQPTDAIPVLEENLDRFMTREYDRLAKAKHSDDKVQQLEDKALCVRALAAGLQTVSELTAMIDTIFADTVPSSDIILFSSVHRAKGLEAHTVRILMPHLMPHPMASTPWMQRQEINVLYVAITRAKVRLIFHGQPAALTLPDTGPQADPWQECPTCKATLTAGDTVALNHGEPCARCGGTGRIRPIQPPTAP